MKRVAFLLSLLLAGASFASCVDFSLFFEQPGARGCTDPFGHWAMSIDGDVFDYGSQVDSKVARLLGTRGGRYWSKSFAPDAKHWAEVKGLRKHIALSKCAVYEIRGQIGREEAAQLRAFWQEALAGDPRYWYFGKQCTTTLFRALRSADLIPEQKMPIMPSALYDIVQSDFVSTCGDSIGDRPKPILLSRPDLRRRAIQ